MEQYKISQSEINSNNVKSAADLLKGDPKDNKSIFDRLPELIATKFNGFVDSVITKFTGYYTKEEVDGKETALSDRINAKANSADVYTKNETYTKTETDKAIADKMVEAGAGDMVKAVYDTNNDGRVNSADVAGYADIAEISNRAEIAENGFFEYIHTAGTLVGSGANGKFKATVSETVTSLKPWSLTISLSSLAVALSKEL